MQQQVIISVRKQPNALTRDDFGSSDQEEARNSGEDVTGTRKCSSKS